eukprot:TRINITY_DN10480_c0_g1_i1.p1 TRINITY_DN10480_c0_g1~~TRINITY_DN10480_c0_g1_i1.p1  ORF type:complete len:299 (+),score=72.27 TRINITY_DN10480_c0_g1_i1:65-898(+)
MDDITFAVPWEGRLEKVPGRKPVPFKGCLESDGPEHKAAYWAWRHDCLMEEMKEGREIQGLKEAEIKALVQEMIDLVEKYQASADDILCAKRMLNNTNATEVGKDELIRTLETEGVAAIKRVAGLLTASPTPSAPQSDRRLQNELTRSRRMLAAAEATAAESNEECDTLSEAVSRKDDVILDMQRKERLHEKEKREWNKEKRNFEHTIRVLEADIKKLEEIETPVKRTPAKRRIDDTSTLQQITNVLSPSPNKPAKRAARPPPVPVEAPMRVLNLSS